MLFIAIWEQLQPRIHALLQERWFRIAACIFMLYWIGQALGYR